MGRTTFTRSLMEFNSRVLTQGTPQEKIQYTAADINELLFFNRVFLTNTEEMFTKHDTDAILDEYADLVRSYIDNIKNIVDRFQQIVPTTKIEIGDRLNYNLEGVQSPEALLKFVQEQVPFIDSIKEAVAPSIEVSKKERQKRRAPTLAEVFQKDFLAEYPNDSFDEYLMLLQQAIDFPGTQAIYITLYRIGSDPSIFNILRAAVQRGIKVFVNIELFASGETINQEWMKKMKKVGITVRTYAAGKLKVHCKLTLIEFVNGRSIVQIGTGNYHTKTTSQYTDLSLVTSDEKITKCVKRVFKVLDDHESQTFTKNLLVTRYNARYQLCKLIDEEGIKGYQGYITMKCNALDDDEIIEHLEMAADNGCRMNLIIRGACTFVPNYPDNRVTIRSVVWDKLEHSRVYSFGVIDPVVYIGSLDLITRKLDRRIETLVRVRDPDIILQVTQYMNRYITNHKNSWIQQPSGIYVKEAVQS